MQHLAGKHRHRSTAIFAALMLAVQLLAGGFAVGAAAAGSPMLDAFGNPLCITSSDVPDAGDQNGHSGLPDCCTPGCSMFAPAAGPDRAPAALSNPLDGPTSIVIGTSVSPVATLPDHDPGNPRAPPLHA